MPNVVPRGINEILEADNSLDITAANGESMPYVGWVEITFKLATDGAPATEVIVPTLVIKGTSLAQAHHRFQRNRAHC